MRGSVSAVFVAKDKVYFIKRQNYLSVFPGYYAAPGGKVDKSDSIQALANGFFPKTVPPQVLHALIREIDEELGFNLMNEIEQGGVIAIEDIGIAITPEFNPYRFKNYYIKITLKEPIDFKVDTNEIEFGEWITPSNLLTRYESGKALAVPPAITLLRTLNANFNHNEIIDLTLPYDPETEVPMIESLFGVRQFLPLSNTFPPANRTNSFIIGDDNAVKILIDPSPKNETELQKFYKSIDKIGFDSIFLTHHHPDHYEYSNVIAKKYNVSMQMSEDTFNRIGPDYFKDIKIIIRREGDIVTKSLGRDIYVYEVPGHDMGQLALAPKTMEWFLAGDLIQTIGTVAILAPEGCMKSYFTSLEKVIKLQPMNIIPSHGIIMGGIDKIIETLDHRKKRELQIIDLLKENASMEEMVKEIYPNLEERLIPYAIKTIESHLQKIKG